MDFQSDLPTSLTEDWRRINATRDSRFPPDGQLKKSLAWLMEDGKRNHPA